MAWSRFAERNRDIASAGLQEHLHRPSRTPHNKMPRPNQTPEPTPPSPHRKTWRTGRENTWKWRETISSADLTAMGDNNKNDGRIPRTRQSCAPSGQCLNQPAERHMVHPGPRNRTRPYRVNGNRGAERFEGTQRTKKCNRPSQFSLGAEPAHPSAVWRCIAKSNISRRESTGNTGKVAVHARCRLYTG